MATSKVLTVVTIDVEGDMSWVKDSSMAGLLATGEATTTRASHIEPVNLVARGLFKIIRRSVPDTHALASWTRVWPCSWRVNLTPSEGPIFGSFCQRQDALDAEVDWLRKNVFNFQG